MMGGGAKVAPYDLLLITHQRFQITTPPRRGYVSVAVCLSFVLSVYLSVCL